jgi:retron-type reverse transcriptase
MDIFNTSLETGIFPEQLKIAKIIPIHKKGNTRNINNYRPIALSSVFSKLLEKMVYNRIITFMEKNRIITEAQHGFRSKRSTETALLVFINNVQSAIDNKMNPVGIFLDLSKAYDVLDHKILLDKLYTYGIRGITNKWMESYLTNRKQFVELKCLK